MNTTTYRVYYLKNPEDKVVWVGYTKRKLHDRWRAHKNVFPHRSSYTIHLIKEYDSKDAAKIAEIFYQTFYDTVNNGENKCYGHSNNDGKLLKEVGKSTRFGTRTKTLEEESLRKTKAREGVKKLHKPIRCLNDGKIYPSLTECCEILNLHISAVSRVLKGTQPHTCGFRFEFVK